MASRVVLLLILGLSLGRGDNLSSGTNISEVLPRPQDSDLECALLTTIPEDSPLPLKVIIRAIANNDLETNIRPVLELGNAVQTSELKNAIYEELWKNWETWHGKLGFYHPKDILEYYENLKQSLDITPEYKKFVYQKFIEDCASYLVLRLPLKKKYDFEMEWITETIIETIRCLQHSPQNYTTDVFEAVFNKVLATTSPLVLAESLGKFGNYGATLSQLTLITIQLLNRTEIKSNSSAQTAVLENLRQLAIHPDFAEKVEYSLRLKLYECLQSGIGLLYTAQKVCLHKANNNNEYLYECQGPTNMCTRERNYERASFEVQRKQIDAKNRTQFAFLSTHFLNRCLAITSEQTKFTTNVYGRNKINWFNVIPVQEGVALQDAATSESLVCGGDSKQWKRGNHFAHTLEAKYIAAYREECSWIVEDCTNKY